MTDMRRLLTWGKVGLAMSLAVCLAACTQPPAPIVISEAEATRLAEPETFPTAIPLAAGASAILRLGVTDFRGLDPLLAGEGTEQVQAMLYETLLVYDEQGALQPLLAAELPQAEADGLVWRVVLRSDIHFHDGTPLDAAAAAESLRAVRSRAADSEAAPLAAAVFAQETDSIEIDTGALVFHLRETVPYFPALLADSSLALTHGEGMGTGPFRLEGELPEKSALMLAANPEYMAGPPALESVEVYILGDGAEGRAAIMESLENGELDLVAAGDWLSDLAVEGYELHAGPARQRWLIFDSAAPPLDRAEVRQALDALWRARDQGQEMLANLGLPDGFDLRVADMLATEGEIGWNALEPVQAIIVPDTDPSPAAYAVEWSRDWMRDWWLRTAGWESDDPVMPGILLDSSSAITVWRVGVTDLGVTAGGWPRITAQTRFVGESEAGVSP